MFLILYKVESNNLTVSPLEENFKSKYLTIENDEINVRNLIEKYLWKPKSKRKMLVNVEAIVTCIEEMAQSDLIRAEHYELLPHLMRIRLRDGTEHLVYDYEDVNKMFEQISHQK